MCCPRWFRADRAFSRAGRGFAEVGGGQFREQVTIYEFGAGMAG